MPGEALQVTIRQAGPADIPAIMACLTAAFEWYRESYTPGGFRDTVLTVQEAERRLRRMTILVAEEHAAGIIGTIAYQALGPDEGHLRGMAVVPAFQGRGIAERLLSAAETALRESGCARVTLDTTQPLKRAARFYVRQGYRPTGTVGDFFGMPLIAYQKTFGD